MDARGEERRDIPTGRISLLKYMQCESRITVLLPGGARILQWRYYAKGSHPPNFKEGSHSFASVTEVMEPTVGSFQLHGKAYSVR